jgi:menaquinone-specific isochorismate synthase
MTRDFAFVQTAPGRVFLGWGPFEQLPFRRPGRPAFFISDFFLDDPHPWRHPAEWEELSVEELAARFESAAEPIELEWSPCRIEAFRGMFESAQHAMAAGEFNKIVPVLFEDAQLLRRSNLVASLMTRLRTVPPELRLYGYSYQTHGMIGATPELLFESEGRGYRTMALAGTRRRDLKAELLTDAKELREHRLVVEDIVRRIAPFGNVEVDTLRIVELPGLAHLTTPIRFEESGAGERMSYADVVRRLHPTAALGVSPRTEAGERWLREADRGVKRRTFGAPFGVEREDHSAIALVAIRNVQWNGDRVRIGSGAGLLGESVLEREFDELRQKRQQVRLLFGLDGGAE